MMATIDCPTCGELDQVQRVASIVAHGTQHTTSRGRTTGVAVGLSGEVLLGGAGTVRHGVTQTILSAQLSPPPRPAYSTTISAVTWLSIIASLLGVLLGLLVLTSAEDAHGPVIGWSILSICALWFFLTLFVHVDHLARNREDAEDAMPDWEAEMAAWEASFYCFRCGTLFQPR